MQYKVISADSHIDLNWLPPELFVSNASTAMKGRMPHVVETSDGPKWVCQNGGTFGFVNSYGGFGRKYVPGFKHRADRMAATGLYEDGQKGIRRLTEPELRLKDQDLDGVQAEVLYGIIGAYTVLQDAEAATEMYRIYNDWLVDFCNTNPQRLIGLASLPPGNISAAVAEVQRVAKLGLHGLEFPTTHDMAPLWDPGWEPLWAAANEAGLPLHFHTVGGSRTPPPAHYPEAVKTAASITHISCFQFTTAQFLAGVIFSGALERHANLRIVLAESGIGWIPYHLDRMDEEYEDRYRSLKLSHKPSEYWQRQCKATFQFDRVGVKLLDELGIDNVMWGSDFPHGDGVWPDSQSYIEKQFGHLPETQRRKIICDNAVRFYGL